MEIANFSDKNMSGFNKVEFVTADAVDEISFPDDERGVNVSLLAGKSWNTLYFTVGTGNMKINQKKDESGTYYLASLSIDNPKLTGEKSAQFIGFEQKDLVAIITTNNGNQILLGTPEQPSRINYKMAVPNVSAGRNSREITFDAVSDEEPYFISVVEEVTGGAFSDGFSTGFNI